MLLIAGGYWFSINHLIFPSTNPNIHALFTLSMIILFALPWSEWCKQIRLGRETGYVLLGIFIYSLRDFLFPNGWQDVMTFLLAIAIALTLFYRISFGFKTIQDEQTTTTAPYIFWKWVLSIIISTLLFFVFFQVLFDQHISFSILIIFGLISLLSDDIEHFNQSRTTHILSLKSKQWGLTIVALTIIWLGLSQSAVWFLSFVQLIAIIFSGILFGFILHRHEQKLSENFLGLFSLFIIGFIVISLGFNLGLFPIVLVMTIVSMTYGSRSKIDNSYVRDLVYPVVIAQILLFVLIFLWIPFEFTFSSIALSIFISVLHGVGHWVRLLLLKKSHPIFYTSLLVEKKYELLLISPTAIITVLLLLQMALPDDGEKITLTSGIIGFFIFNRFLVSALVRYTIFSNKKEFTTDDQEKVLPKNKLKTEVIGLTDWIFSDQELQLELDKLKKQIQEQQTRLVEYGFREQLEETTLFVLTFQEGALDFIIRLKASLTDQKDGVRSDVFKETVRNERINLYKWFSGLIIKTANQNLYQDRFQHIFTRYFQSVEKISLKVKPVLQVSTNPMIYDSEIGDTLSTKIKKSYFRKRNSLIQYFSGAYPKRFLPLREISRYQFSGEFPIRCEKTVNMFHAQGWYAITETIKVFNQLDKITKDILIFSDQYQDGKIPIDALGKFFQSNLVVLNEEMMVLNEDIHRYNQEIELNFHSLSNSIWNEFHKQISIADTFLLPENKYRIQRISGARHRALERYKETDSIWATYALGVASSFSLQLEIAGLQARLRHTLNESIADFHSLIRTRLELPFENAKKRLIQTKKRISKSLELGTSPSEILIELQEEFHAIESLLEKGNKKLELSIKNRDSETLQKSYFTAIKEMIISLPISFDLIDDRHLQLSEWNSPPPPQLIPAPVRETAIQYMEIELYRNLSDDIRKLEQLMESALSNQLEIMKIIQFNFEAVIQSLRNSQQDPIHDIRLIEDQIVKLLDRLVIRLEDIIHEFTITSEKITDHIVFESIEKSRTLREIIHNKGLLDLHETEAHNANWLYQDFQIIRRVRSYYNYWLQRIRVIYKRRYGALTDEVIGELQGFLQLKDHHSYNLLSLQKEIELVEKKFQNFPMIYRRLFNFEPLETEDLLVGREDAIKQLKQAFELFNNGHRISVAVIGEMGTGKTSLINIAIRKQIFEGLVYRIKFQDTILDEAVLVKELSSVFNIPDHVESLDQLKIILKALEIKGVIILESVHRLFLRKIGGYNLLRKLIIFSSEVSEQILFVMTYNEHAWNLLTLAIDLDRFFNVQVKTRNFSEKDLANALLVRQKLTGYDFDVKLNEWHKFTLKLFPLRSISGAAIQNRKIQLYFKKLSELSEGSIQAALLNWIRSVDVIDDRKVVLREPKNLDVSALHHLSIDHLILISILLIHGGMNIDMMASVLNVPTEVIRGHIAILQNARLIEQVLLKGNPQFMVNRMIHPNLVQILKDKRIFK